MYYIYEIPGIKVGCTNNIGRRIKHMGYDRYKILNTTRCINEASELEVYWQRKLGYKEDARTYLETVKNNKEMKTHVTEQTITFKGAKNVKSLNDLLQYHMGEELDCNNDLNTVLTEEVANWIHLNANKSALKNGDMYIYTQAFKKFVSQIDDVKSIAIFNKIREWATDKGIYEAGDIKTQTLKLQEEVGELSKAIINKDSIEIVDAIGDAVVVLTSIAEMQGVSIEKCITSAYHVIKERTGKMSNGSFVKSK